MKGLLAGIATMVALVCAFSAVQVEGGDKAKYTISEVMKKGINGKTSLFSKVKDGSASAAEKATFVEMLEALHANMPKKGSADSWNTKTTAFLDAAKKGDAAALAKAGDCKACHSEHRGK